MVPGMAEPCAPRHPAGDGTIPFRLEETELLLPVECPRSGNLRGLYKKIMAYGDFVRLSWRGNLSGGTKGRGAG